MPPLQPKPSAKASSEDQQQYRKAARLASLPQLASQQITQLRRDLDAEPAGASRRLLLFLDGGFTNSTVLKDIPANTTLVGRIRQDAKLYHLPDTKPGSQRRGRPIRYGERAPTPEQLRADDSTPWQTIEVSISGTVRRLRVKCLKHLLWRTAGLQHTLQLVVIAPLGYRLRKGSKLLYHRPAYLICNDPEMDLQSLVQGYIQRWDIEVNFREQKTLLGVGQAQVRNAESVAAVPALQVASYALLLLATLRAFRGPDKPGVLPLPKWAAEDQKRRFSTPRAINQLRAEVWGRGLGLTNFSGFATQRPSATKPEKFLPDLRSAVFYAMN